MSKTLNLKIQNLVLNKKFYVSRKNTIRKKVIIGHQRQTQMEKLEID